MNHPCSFPRSSPRVRVLPVLGILVFFAIPSLAHDPQHRPDIDAWMRELRNERAQSCCAGNDATRAAAAWDMQKGRYMVEIDMDGKSGWYEVPDGALVKGPNLAGHALVWWYRMNTYGVSYPEIRCFMPGTSG